MPNRDGTGPFGDGRPGLGMGPCGRTDVPFRGGRRGRFGGRGFARRCFWDYHPTANADDYPTVYSYDKASLLKQKSELENQLKWLNEQLANDKDQQD